jgi:hypothetical protein
MSALDWPKTKLFPQLAKDVAGIPVPRENPDHQIDDVSAIAAVMFGVRMRPPRKDSRYPASVVDCRKARKTRR